MPKKTAEVKSGESRRPDSSPAPSTTKSPVDFSPSPPRRVDKSNPVADQASPEKRQPSRSGRLGGFSWIIASVVVVVAVALAFAFASEYSSSPDSFSGLISLLRKPFGSIVDGIGSNVFNDSGKKLAEQRGREKPDMAKVDRSAILKVASEKKQDAGVESQVEKAVSSAPVSIQRVFFNDHDKPIEIHWHNPDKSEDIKMSTIAVGATMNFNTYVNHVFKFKEETTLKVLKTLVITDDYDGKPIGTKTDNRAKSFEAEYFKATGTQWLNTYRQKPAKYHIWNMENIGDEVEVTLKGGSHSGPEENEILPDFTQTLKMISRVPKIFYIDRFLTDEEADYIHEKAEKKGDLKRSTVAEKGILDDGRTSSNTWLNCDHSSRIMDLCIRGFDLVKIPFDSSNWTKASESFQVVHYGLGQEYRPHHDYFAPSEYPNSPSILSGNNRLLTLFVYLNDVDGGGETVFPRANGGYVDKACENPEGFKVKPKKGAAIIFYSMLEDGNLDVNSLHGGCPVKVGEKWAANLWFWDEHRNA